MTINDKYINAVFNFDVKKFKKLLETEPFDISLLTNIGDGIPCPIQWITQFWEIIFEHPENWEEDCREIIAENKQRNLEIKQILIERFNVDFKPIDFYNSDLWFDRHGRDDTFEDVLYESRDSMIAKGYRAIDLDLFVAVSKYDFKETERLLELGANPVCIIKSEGDIIPYYCMDSIGTECSYLNIELQDIIIDRVQRNPMKGDSVILIYLAGLAANESMYSLLSKYDPREDVEDWLKQYDEILEQCFQNRPT